MKNFFFILCILLAPTVRTEAAQPAPGNPSYPCITLPSGTLVLMESLEKIDSERATVGKLVQMRVRTNVVIQNEVVISTGAMALGRIKSIRKASYNLPEMIVIEPFQVQGADGRMVALSGAEQAFEGMFPNESMTVDPGQVFSAFVMNNENIQVP